MRMETRLAEAGSAMLIVTMVAVILALLGLSFLALASQENSIAVNQRDSDQLLFVAEAGARMVKAWFDRPVQGDPNAPLFRFMGVHDLRTANKYDRTKRLFDHDNDPNTPEVLADGTSGRPYFRQGMQASPTDPNYLTFWDKPYRGTLAAELKGLETGPDLVIESDTTSVDWLDTINRDVIGDRAMQETVGRISKIEVFAPPVILQSGVKTRYGFATVKVTSSKFKRLDLSAGTPTTSASSVEVGRRVVKMVLNETPYPGPTGPFHSCVQFQINGNVTIYWGEVASATNIDIGGGTEAQLKGRTAPSIPYASVNRFITGTTLTDWIAANNGGSSGLDPWFRLRSGGLITVYPDPNVIQLYPYAPIATIAADESNIFQNAPPQCPSFDYQIWKNVALSGGQDIHYMIWDNTTSNWKEDGVGTGANLQTWVDGREGFWFFDTKDRLPPDPTGTNLTPTSAIGITGGWSSAGFIYLNGNWDSAGSGTGVNRVVIPPGEPWNDADADGVADADEYTNLGYPTALGTAPTVYQAGNPLAGQTGTATTANGVSYTYTTDPNARDDQGVPFLGPVHLQGVLFVAGTFQMTGNLRVFGSVVAKGGMPTVTAGTPEVWFDERLIKGGWPPPELNLPRTMITFYQTEL